MNNLFLRTKSLEFQTIKDITQISPKKWNQLVPPNFPFMDHEFLCTLEKSNSVGGDSGWEPAHLTLWDKDQLLGAMILYQKYHSYGEYIFDWGWAEAYERHGIDYYPKMISAVPFTPATGRKLLIHPDADQEKTPQLLLNEALKTIQTTKISSLHCLFITADEISTFEANGFLIRHSFQFHWKNRDYNDFDDFLKCLKRKKRKEIKRERKQIQDQSIQIRLLEGSQIAEKDMHHMYQFYISTSNRKWGQAYLTPDFFRLILKNMQNSLVLILAYQNEECIAGTINYRKGNCLYGRYWGCNGNYRSLHFELCYYQPIEYAIKNKIKLFEAGAQGEHKIQRGFLPELTYSAHWLLHPEFNQAVSHFVEQEKAALSQSLLDFKNNTPYQEASLA